MRYQSVDFQAQEQNAISNGYQTLDINCTSSPVHGPTDHNNNHNNFHISYDDHNNN